MSIEHARALTIMSLRGVDEPTARGILFDLGQAGIHLKMTEPPVEPFTGDKAPNPTERVANLKAIVRSVTKPTEYEEQA